MSPTPELKPDATPSQTPLPKSQEPEKKEPEKKESKSGSIYDDLKIEEPGAEGSSTWPTDWRKQFAGGDEKVAKQFERFQSPAEVAKSLLAAQQKIRSGEYKRTATPKADDPEAMKAWREENQIPETPDQYQFIPEGVKPEEIDENAKASITFIQESFHKANIPAPVAKEVAGVMVKMAEQQAERQAQADAQNQNRTEDDLRAEWGKDYRVNLQANMQVMETHFGDDVDAILTARTSDGRRLSDIPAFNKAIQALARAEGGDILLAGEGTGSSIEKRIGEIEAVMNKSMGEYLGTKGMAEEYQALLEKREARKR
jgi:hypothetical protein